MASPRSLNVRPVIAVFVLLWAGAGLAQERAWTLADALKQALASHPSVLARLSAVQAAEADHDAALWQRYPTPSLQAISGGNSNLPGTTSTLQVQQPLWTGGRITAGIDATHSRKDAADRAVAEAQRELALRVAIAFVEAARQQTREAQGRRSVEEHRNLLELIGRRVTQEVSAPVDRELAQSRLYLAINELSLSTQQRISALTQLTQLLGQPVARVQMPPHASLPLPASEAQALDQAIALSPTLARIEAETRAASADVDSRRAALWPQVGVRYQRFFGGLSDERLMLVLEAQPGAGLSAGSNIDAAVARKRAIEHERAAALRDLNEQVGTAWNELQYSRERLANAELSRRTSEAVFQSFARQYTTGRKTWIDVMNSVREFTQAEFAVADATGQYATAALRLAVLSGTLPLPTK